MAGKGQPNKYYTHVEPYLDKIKEMTQNMTEKQIAQTLGVAYSSFRTYKKEHPALVDALKKGRAELVMELKSTLIQKARGFNYEEKKQVIEHGVVVREEIYTKAATPDVAALNLLLKNYDKENWANDPQALELRKQELELQKLKLEDANW
jgi:hypothetical protein